jgi:cytochrome o ubiquinol oxidase subunit IV
MIGYVIGFVLSLLLTGGAYVSVTQQLFTGGALIAVIITLAVLQVLVQLYFFLHLGRETKPRWKLVVLIAMLVVLFILVFGSLWIMQNLNYHMSPDQVNHYMIQQNNRGF